MTFNKLVFQHCDVFSVIWEWMYEARKEKFGETQITLQLWLVLGGLADYIRAILGTTRSQEMPGYISVTAILII